MLKRHEYELENRLDRVHLKGSAEIEKSELLLWYDMKRLNKNAWRNIHERWSDIVEDVDTCRLMVAERDKTYVFIWGQGLSEGDDSWFADVRSKLGLAETETEGD